MSEFADRRGERFELVDLTGSTFERVRLGESRWRRIDLSGSEWRSVYVEGARMLGVEMNGVDLTGEFVDVTINGVDIAPLVEAELDRRQPDRAKMRPTTADGYREAWPILERRWAELGERARALPSAALHERVAGEWSFVETLRHLGFATAAWVGRMVLGDPTPWHPLDLPWDEAPGWDGVPWDRDVRPDLAEVLAVRSERQAMVRDVLGALTDEQLAADVGCIEPGWPRIESTPLAECLRVVLIEEWEHANYASRDLDALESFRS